MREQNCLSHLDCVLVCTGIGTHIIEKIIKQRSKPHASKESFLQFHYKTFPSLQRNKEVG